MSVELDSSDHAVEIERLLVGRSIVEADIENSTLTLDNGEVLDIKGNEGCGGCGNGWYEVTRLNTFPNAITSAEIRDGEDEEEVSLFVYSEGVGEEVIRSEGYDNGYYGTGFNILATRRDTP